MLLAHVASKPYLLNSGCKAWVAALTYKSSSSEVEVFGGYAEVIVKDLHCFLMGYQLSAAEDMKLGTPGVRLRVCSGARMGNLETWYRA